MKQSILGTTLRAKENPATTVRGLSDERSNVLRWVEHYNDAKVRSACYGKVNDTVNWSDDTGMSSNRSGTEQRRAIHSCFQKHSDWV